MEKDKLYEKIRKSSENIPVPRSLTPEAMETKLSGQRRRSWIRPAAAAAAVLLLTVGVWAASRRNLTDTAGEMSAAASGTTRQETQQERASAGSDAFPSITDYEELYAALEEQETAVMSTYDTEIGISAIAEDSMAAAGTTAASSDTALQGDYSVTNLRTEGVDEGDILRTDGQYLYILSRNQGIRIVRAGSMELIRELSPEDYSDSFREMYVDGDSLVVIASRTTTDLTEDSEDTYEMESDEETIVYTYDISDPAKPSLSGSRRQDGSYLSSRKTGDFLYLFTRYTPDLPEDSGEYRKYVPALDETLLPEEDIYIPSICTESSSLVISSMDIRKPGKTIDTKSVLSGASSFYVSGTHIYIYNSQWMDSGEITQIMSFAYDKGSITARAAGSVDGTLNNSFSLDEHEDHLRVVSTKWNDAQEINALYILDEDLKITGKIDDLAPGETIRSARFLGDTGYFVTYRQMDPLFSVDLSDADHPRILGELKITGFSEYLHFYGEDLLLGIGWETDPDTGAPLGLKLSMFDISNPANVTEKDKLVIKNVYESPATEDYKTVMIDVEKNLLGFAHMSQKNGDFSRTHGGYSVFRYDPDKGFTELFTSSLNNDPEEPYQNLWHVRGLYAGDSFYLSTDESLTQFDMTQDFQQTAKLNW